MNKKTMKMQKDTPAGSTPSVICEVCGMYRKMTTNDLKPESDGYMECTNPQCPSKKPHK